MLMPRTASLAEIRAGLTLARALLDQQFWCWGQDIQHGDGDALRRYGLCLERDVGLTRGRRYLGRADPGVEVALWGFGLLWQDEAGGLAVWRDDGRPRLTGTAVDARAVRGASDLIRHPLPHGPAERRRALTLTAALMRWMASYEEWALETLGYGHRLATVAGWSRPTCRAGEAPALWRGLAGAADDYQPAPFRLEAFRGFSARSTCSGSSPMR